MPSTVDERKEVYISDLKSSVIEKESLSEYMTKNKWKYVSYETDKAKGTLLVASGKTRPKPLTLRPNLTGWYKIFVCQGELITYSFEGYSHIDLKLTSDEFPSTVKPCKIRPFTMWTSSELFEEALWKCADMTGQDITISKPDKGYEYPANIVWFRFVPMSEEEVKAHLEYKPTRTMFAHMDGDFHAMDITNTPHDYCKPIYAMKDSDVGIICEEVINDLVDYVHPGEDYIYGEDFSAPREVMFKELKNNRFSVYKEQIDYAHKYGIKMFAGHRMQLSNFSFPFDYPLFHIQFVDDNKDKMCQARDGTTIEFLSYGYEEVQDFMIKAMLESAKQGFDGVLCIWTRGIHLLFENPIKNRFKDKFGGIIDYRKLKEDDPRLVEIRCDIITDFYKKARKAFNDYAKSTGKNPLKIYLTGCYDVFSSKKEGLDFERLAKEGLIDGVIQTKLKMVELVDDVLDSEGNIDIEKYSEKAKNNLMINRITGSNPDLIVEGSKAYRAIADKYNIDYYAELPWENVRRPEEYVHCAKEFYSSSVKALSLWDCYHPRVNAISEWAAVSRLGDKESTLKMSENPDDYHRIIKVLSYNGKDVRYYSPSWRG